MGLGKRLLQPWPIAAQPEREGGGKKVVRGGAAAPATTGRRKSAGNPLPIRPGGYLQQPRQRVPRPGTPERSVAFLAGRPEGPGTAGRRVPARPPLPW